MADLQLVESQSAIVDMSPESATLLSQLGTQLASSSQWWGRMTDTVDRSVINVEHFGADRYRVVFRNVVGVVRLPGCQVQVVPKIPVMHFLYLIGRSEIAPRITPKDVSISPVHGLVEILAQWCLAATEDLLRVGRKRLAAPS